MRFQKQLAGLCLLTLLTTIALTTQVQVLASPGLSLTKYKPTTYEKGPDAFLVDNPTLAYDWNNGTAAYFEAGSVSLGYFELKGFSLKSGYTAPPEGSAIAFVDFCIRQEGGGGGTAWYRVYYKVGLSGTTNPLVDWTRTNYVSATTVVWSDSFEPNDGKWSTDDLSDIAFRIETKFVGSADSRDFYTYEVWINVYYYNQTTLSGVAPTTRQVSPFTVDITVASVDSLYSWEIELNYNTTCLTATDVVAGSFFPVGKNPHFWELEVNDTAGRVRAAGSLTGDVIGQDGSGVLATISFADPLSGPLYTQALDLKVTKLVGYDYANKRIFDMTHLVSDGSVLLTIAGDITGPESPPGSGEYPPDGTVSNLDLVYLNNKFGTTDPVADITANGLVDAKDLYALGRNFGASV